MRGFLTQFYKRFFKVAARRARRAQLELPLTRQREPDRNFEQGGRSFYFFDFDDNVAFLTTPMFLVHKETGAQIELSSRQFAEHSGQIGVSGLYADYRLDYDPNLGSFRHFRDVEASWLKRLLGHQQIFVQDLGRSLLEPDIHWQGPSWNCFYHAVFNGRPVALITARGHHPETLRTGIRLWVDEGHLPAEPNYLKIYPVNHSETKAALGMPESNDVPELKRLALRDAVGLAIRQYGSEAPHRFGMSDDDPRNLEWIAREMTELKREHAHMSFFIILTSGTEAIKREIFADHTEDQVLESGDQLSLFD